MSRRQKIYKYKSYVDKENIKFRGCIELNQRYLLEVPLIRDDENQKTVLVIMKNPSVADKNNSDHTINNVLKFCWGKGYRKVLIMNLYSFYSTDPKGIANHINNNQIHLAVGEDNDKVLKDVLSEVYDIIVAWGGNTFGLTDYYKNRIKQVYKIINSKNLYYVESVSGEGWYPRHPQVWSVNKQIDMITWSGPTNNKQ
ncbi:DUF1643 domain-containing protein [Brevibacillus fortis]|uniref:DUF1643 domain-containing protein n=1 Tax=Brevibacillus fortis TaxID=2126352 RepID=UPI0038FCDBA0